MKIRKNKFIGVIIHHTATPETTTMEQLLNIFKKKGYATYGYNFIIKRNMNTNEASIKKGRDLKYIGAHTYIESVAKAKSDKLAKGNRNYYNENFFSIALMGNYEKYDIDILTIKKCKMCKKTCIYFYINDTMKLVIENAI